ncbi:MAG: type II secretion system protein [Isosphaeraceae bacterium]
MGSALRSPDGCRTERNVPDRGFTLIELTVTLGILCILFDTSRPTPPEFRHFSPNTTVVLT